MTEKELSKLIEINNSIKTYNNILKDIERGYWIKVLTPDHGDYIHGISRDRLIEWIKTEKAYLEAKLSKIELNNYQEYDD